MWNGLLFVHPSFEGSADKPRRKADWILFLPQIWPLPGRVKMLHSQCFNTFLRIWCFSLNFQNRSKLLAMKLAEWIPACATASYTLNVSMNEETLQIALTAISATRTSHAFTLWYCTGCGISNTALPSILSFKTKPVYFFNWPASHHCYELVFPWIFRAN